MEEEEKIETQDKIAEILKEYFEILLEWSKVQEF